VPEFQSCRKPFFLLACFLWCPNSALLDVWLLPINRSTCRSVGISPIRLYQILNICRRSKGILYSEFSFKRSSVIYQYAVKFRVRILFLWVASCCVCITNI
jgi:hypothetical protein